MCPEGIFEGKNSQIKIIFLHQFVNLSWWFSGYLAKNFANITKAAFYLSRLTFCQKNVLEKKNSTLADFQGKNLRISGEKCLEGISEGTNFAKNVIRIFIDFGRESFKLFPKSSQQSCQHGVLRIQRMNSRKKMEVYSSLIFSDTAQTFLDFMWRVFRRNINYAFYAPKGSFKGIFCLESAFRIHGFQTITCAGLLHKPFR